jgi:hypothetical protein
VKDNPSSGIALQPIGQVRQLRLFPVGFIKGEQDDGINALEIFLM